jgi:hypothetical protein
MTNWHSLLQLHACLGMAPATSVAAGASSFCSQHDKSFAPWPASSCPSRARHFFVHSGCGVFGLCPRASLPTSEGNSQFSQPTFSTHEQKQPCTIHKPPITKHRPNNPLDLHTCTVSDHTVETALLLRTNPRAPGCDGSAKRPERARRLLFSHAAHPSRSSREKPPQSV